MARASLLAILALPFLLACPGPAADPAQKKADPGPGGSDFVFKVLGAPDVTVGEEKILLSGDRNIITDYKIYWSMEGPGTFQTVPGITEPNTGAYIFFIPPTSLAQSPTHTILRGRTKDPLTGLDVTKEIDMPILLRTTPMVFRLEVGTPATVVVKVGTPFYGAVAMEPRPIGYAPVAQLSAPEPMVPDVGQIRIDPEYSRTDTQIHYIPPAAPPPQRLRCDAHRVGFRSLGEPNPFRDDFISCEEVMGRGDMPRAPRLSAFGRPLQ